MKWSRLLLRTLSLGILDHWRKERKAETFLITILNNPKDDRTFPPVTSPAVVWEEEELVIGKEFNQASSANSTESVSLANDPRLPPAPGSGGGGGGGWSRAPGDGGDRMDGGGGFGGHGGPAPPPGALHGPRGTPMDQRQWLLASKEARAKAMDSNQRQVGDESWRGHVDIEDDGSEEPASNVVERLFASWNPEIRGTDLANSDSILKDESSAKGEAEEDDQKQSGMVAEKEGSGAASGKIEAEDLKDT